MVLRARGRGRAAALLAGAARGDLRPAARGRAGGRRGRRVQRGRRVPVRAHRRAVLAQPRDGRARGAPAAGRQPLRQPAHHRRDGRPPAVRGQPALGHRREGGRPRLPAPVRRSARRHREHDAPRARRRVIPSARVARTRPRDWLWLPPWTALLEAPRPPQIPRTHPRIGVGGMKPRSDISDPRVIKALTHPLRIQILRLLEERIASPSELADEIGAPLGNVSYHVRQLHGLGLIKLVKKTPRRGAIEHHYKAVAQAPISDEAWAGTPGLVKESVVGSTLGQLGKDVNAAASGGGFKRPEAQLVREELALDEKGFADVAKELARTAERVAKIRDDAARRLAKGNGDGGHSANVVLMLFEGNVEPATNGAAARPRAKTRR